MGKQRSLYFLLLILLINSLNVIGSSGSPPLPSWLRVGTFFEYRGEGEYYDLSGELLQSPVFSSAEILELYPSTNEFLVNSIAPGMNSGQFVEDLEGTAFIVTSKELEGLQLTSSNQIVNVPAGRFTCNKYRSTVLDEGLVWIEPEKMIIIQILTPTLKWELFETNVYSSERTVDDLITSGITGGVGGVLTSLVGAGISSALRLPTIVSGGLTALGAAWVIPGALGGIGSAWTTLTMRDAGFEKVESVVVGTVVGTAVTGLSLVSVAVLAGVSLAVSTPGILVGIGMGTVVSFVVSLGVSK